MVDPGQLPDVLTWNLPRKYNRIYIVYSPNAYRATKMLIKEVTYQDPDNRYLFGVQYAKPDAPTGSDAAIPNHALIVDGSAWGQLSEQHPHMIVWQLFCGRQDLSLLEMPAIVVIGMPFACDTRCLVGSSKSKKTAFIDSEARMLTVMASCAPYASPVFARDDVYKTIFNASNPCTKCGTDLLSGELSAATCRQGHTTCTACVVQAGKKCPAKVFSGKGLESSHQCDAKMASFTPSTPKRLVVEQDAMDEEEAPPPPILKPAPEPIVVDAPPPPILKPAPEPISRAMDIDEEDSPPPLIEATECLSWPEIELQMQAFTLPVPEPVQEEVEEEEEEEDEYDEEELELYRRRRNRNSDPRNSLFGLPDPQNLGRSTKRKAKKSPAHLEEEDDEEEEEEEFDTGYTLRASTAQAKVENKAKPPARRRRKTAEVVEEEEVAEVEVEEPIKMVFPPLDFWADAASFLDDSNPVNKQGYDLFGDQAHILNFVSLPYGEALPQLPIDQMLPIGTVL